MPAVCPCTDVRDEQADVGHGVYDVTNFPQQLRGTVVGLRLYAEYSSSCCESYSSQYEQANQPQQDGHARIIAICILATECAMSIDHERLSCDRRTKYAYAIPMNPSVASINGAIPAKSIICAASNNIAFGGFINSPARSSAPSAIRAIV